MPNQLIVTATQNWLHSFIIAYNICPFARHVAEAGGIRYQVIAGANQLACLESLMAECRLLDQESSVITTLLILPQLTPRFDDFLDFLAIAEQLLIDQGYEGIYQLASFHPAYCFAGSQPDDPANYTNRSPHPMLHIIRESSIDLALQTFENPESIPDRNIALTRKMGLEKLQSLLRAAMETPAPANLD